MKAKLVMLTLLATSTLAHATLIDLTPGGFSVNNPPPAYLQFLKQWLKPATFLIPGANINGSQVDWSPFCLFGPANFSIDSHGTNALVGWNLADTNGYIMQYVLVEGQGGFDNLYGITGQSFRFNGMGFVTIDGQNTIPSHCFLWDKYSSRNAKFTCSLRNRSGRTLTHI
jgi:hypothetical protein